jgi:hypothetical protein
MRKPRRTPVRRMFNIIARDLGGHNPEYLKYKFVHTADFILDDLFKQHNWSEDKLLRKMRRDTKN